jgi:hypothetical protein
VIGCTFFCQHTVLLTVWGLIERLSLQVMTVFQVPLNLVHFLYASKENEHKHKRHFYWDKNRRAAR